MTIQLIFETKTTMKFHTASENTRNPGHPYFEQMTVYQNYREQCQRNKAFFTRFSSENSLSILQRTSTLTSSWCYIFHLPSDALHQSLCFTSPRSCLYHVTFHVSRFVFFIPAFSFNLQSPVCTRFRATFGCMLSRFNTALLALREPDIKDDPGP